MTAPAGSKEAVAVEKAVAHLSPASGSAVSGTVTFTRQPTGVEVHIVLEGLTPGAHGLHIHETGDCSAADAMTAGDHFNPGHAPHAGRDANERHVGDLGNVMADGAGKVDVTFSDRMLALSGESSILGRSVIVHADADDLVSQPAGNSGARIACGVIEEAKSDLSVPGGG
jgi:superoxide dismutase, Cu-Zn family